MNSGSVDLAHCSLFSGHSKYVAAQKSKTPKMV